MNNMSKIFKCLLLSAVVLCSAVKETKAFLPIPPMIFTPEINIPNNANKIISNLQSVYRQIQSIKTNGLSGGLAGLKLGNFSVADALKGKFGSLLALNKSETKGGNKTPGKKGVLKDSDLGLPDPNSPEALNEEVYYNAYFKLFFQLPSKDSYSGNYAVLQTAYAQKKLDYQQDIIVDTYIAGKMNEDLLNIIEKTVNRLDKCRIGDLRDDECVFFGMQLGYTDPNTVETPETEGEQAGMIGESTNAYIIATVYDRLLRIVEDLTAIEAIYRAAKQTKTVEPISTSSNSVFLENKFQFAYNSTKEYRNAKLNLKNLLNGNVLNVKLDRKNQCANGGNGCPKVNEDGINLQSMEDSQIYRELQPVDDLLTNVMVVHNLKSELASYKTQYRKYLKTIEIHDRALKVLGESDNCVVDFFHRHHPAKDRLKATDLWYGTFKTSDASNHEARGGVSREVIEEYQKYITDTIIGTDSDECDGYYEKNACPDGYVSDEKNPCESDKSLFPCVVELATSDMEVGNYSEDVTDFTTMLDEEESDNDADEAEGLIDGTVVDNIKVENRKKAERPWRIGAQAVTKLAKEGKLEFVQWNDQKNIHEEYMTNKYRNIRMIIRSTDKALSSYRIAKVLSNADVLDKASEPMARLVEKVTAVKTAEEAIEDKSAIKYAASQGMCNGFFYDGAGDKYIKPVTASWSETKTQTIKEQNEDGLWVNKVVSYTKNNTKDINLECYAVKKDTGIVKIMQQNYKDGKNPNSSGAITLSQSGEIDLRIMDNAKSYPDVFQKESASIAVSSVEEGCPPAWNFTVNDIVKNFLRATLGECGATLDDEVSNLYNTAKKSKRTREVASDILDNVISVKDKEEAKIKNIINTYNIETTKLKNRRQTLIRNRKTWSEAISNARDSKNDVVTRKENAKQRVLMIETEIRDTANKIMLTQEKLNKNPTLIKLKDEIATLNDSIVMLAIEMDCINNSNEKECKTCLELENNKQKCKTYNNDSYISMKEADRLIKQYDSRINENQTRIDDSKAEVAKIDEELVAKAENFADDYIESAEEAQDNIEEANKVFEDFVAEEDGPRMKAKNGKYKGDDALMQTIAAFYRNVNDKTIDKSKAKSETLKYVKSKIEEEWFSSINPDSDVFKALNLPKGLTEINVGQVLDLGMNVTLGVKKYSSFTEIIETIKAAMATAAAEKIVNYIEQADNIISDEMDAAIKEVNEWSGSMLCLKGEGEAETSPTCKQGANVGGKYDIMLYTNYLTKDKVKEYKDSNEENIPQTGSITLGHLKLIKDLSTPTAQNKSILEKAGVNLKTLFGIPNDEVITTDSEYFVALPARGVSSDANIKDSDRCSYKGDSKYSAGCDYMSPREPLSTIPPLREVFYFDAQDYDEIPTSKKHGPTISSLLNFKYADENFEYLPEVWNYILARPNMRRDGKYQQTFVERGYGQNEVANYLDNFENDKSRLLLARGGVFPCVLSGSVIDLSGNNEIKKVKITRRTGSIPQGAARVKCHDVGYYDTTYIQHLLADFDASKKASKNLALEKVEAGSNVGMHTNYSELSQFLRRDKKKIKYRQLAENSFAYLLNKKNQKNNVDKQLAETVSFKRNVIGSFIENVDAEFNAKKNMNKSKQDILDTLKVLCEQLSEHGAFVETQAGLEGDAKNEACAIAIMENGGLASSSSDNKYDVSSKDCANVNSSRGYYASIFCALDGVKAQKLTEARKLYEGIMSRYSDAEKDNVKERIVEIENYIGAFEEDAEEVSVISPGATRESTKEAVRTANANRKTSIKTDEAAITAMDNQSRSTAYCPVY